MEYEFIAQTALILEQGGYLIERDPVLAGIQALLYAHSLQRYRLGFAKIEDHFLFVDWENAAFARLEGLISIYREFSRFVNRAFRTPHALRMQIPNLALIAVSRSGFPEAAARYVRRTNLTPWYRGETGQMVLVEPGQEQVITLVPLGDWRSPMRGALPLSRTSATLREVFQNAFLAAG